MSDDEQVRLNLEGMNREQLLSILACLSNSITETPDRIEKIRSYTKQVNDKLETT